MRYALAVAGLTAMRSPERPVVPEGRSRWAPDHYKDNAFVSTRPPPAELTTVANGMRAEGPSFTAVPVVLVTVRTLTPGEVLRPLKVRVLTPLKAFTPDDSVLPN